LQKINACINYNLSSDILSIVWLSYKFILDCLSLFIYNYRNFIM